MRDDFGTIVIGSGLAVPPKDQLGKSDDEFVKAAQEMVT
jgi:hypothetical protein